jgi:hypothetical protein
MEMNDIWSQPIQQVAKSRVDYRVPILCGKSVEIGIFQHDAVDGDSFKPFLSQFVGGTDWRVVYSTCQHFYVI